MPAKTTWAKKNTTKAKSEILTKKVKIFDNWKKVWTKDIALEWDELRKRNLQDIEDRIIYLKGKFARWSITTEEKDELILLLT